MKFDILTIFPDIVYSYAGESILKRAQKAGLVEIAAHDFREYTADKQRRVDDRPYGGEPVWFSKSSRFTIASRQYPPKADRPWAEKAIKGKNTKTKILIMDPAGKKFDQRMAEKFSKLDRLVLVCGRYEGFDERIYKLADEKISAGDYVLSGGELPALTIVEAVSRLIPGVLGNVESLVEESHNKKLNITSEYPQYTRPEDFMGFKVPKVLLSGNHKKIAEWRKKRLK